MAANAIAQQANKPNIGNAERIGSALAGAVLVGRGLLHPTLGRLVLALGGAALLQRGLTGHSGLYRALGIDTADVARQPGPADDPVTSASEDSFPASDPPSWTPVAGTAKAR